MGLDGSRFLRACRREEVDRPPVWFMRQAGRYLPEYLALRRGRTFMESARDPAHCAAITLQPVTRFGVDAAILFADIMSPLDGVALPFEISAGVGPVIASPVCTLAAVRALSRFAASEMAYLGDAIGRIKAALGAETPLIGFAGAPFTMACYLIEGRGSRDFLSARRLLHDAPEFWHALMQWLSEMTIDYLRFQVESGVDALQLFDSWVGLVSPGDYRRAVFPYMRSIGSAVASWGVPLIHFGAGCSGLLELMAEAAGDVVGVDWRVELGEAWQRIGWERGIQGNLDPSVLLASPEVIRGKVAEVLRAAVGRRGHIFNVGHGLSPQTPPEHVACAVAAVRAWQA